LSTRYEYMDKPNFVSVIVLWYNTAV